MTSSVSAVEDIFLKLHALKAGCRDIESFLSLNPKPKDVRVKLSELEECLLAFASCVDAGACITKRTHRKIEDAKLEAEHVRQKVLSWLDGVEVSSECGKAHSEPTLKLSCHSSAKELDDNSRVEYHRSAEFRSSYSSVKGVEYCMTGPWDESVSRKSLKGFDSDMTVPRKSALDFEGGKSDVRYYSSSKAKASRVPVNLKLASLSFKMSEERCKDEERLAEFEAKLEAKKNSIEV